MRLDSIYGERFSVILTGTQVFLHMKKKKAVLQFENQQSFLCFMLTAALAGIVPNY